MEGNMADNAETNDEGTENGETAEAGARMESEGGSARTFTQAELDAIVEARIARERKKTPTDYADLKKKAEAFDKAESEKLGEVEKANKAREEAEARANALQAERDKDKIEAALMREAVKQGARNTDVVLRAVDKTGLTIGDDGQVSGASEAIKSLLAELPALVGSHAGSADQGARGGATQQITAAQLEKMTDEEITKATQEGRLDHLLG